MEYQIKNYSKEKLEDFGFRFNGYLSNPEETYYTNRFPAYRYRGIVTIEADITIRLEDGRVSVDVFDKASHGKYASWYCRNVLGYCGENRVVDEIDAMIKKKFARFGIKETE